MIDRLKEQKPLTTHKAISITREKLREKKEMKRILLKVIKIKTIMKKVRNKTIVEDYRNNADQIIRLFWHKWQLEKKDMSYQVQPQRMKDIQKL